MLEKINAMIVDDLAEAREELQYMLAKHTDVEVVASVNTPDAAWERLQEGGIDVVFLDIIFDNITDGEQAGFDLARDINQLDDKPLIVFLTWEKAYALEAYDFFPFSFLAKPFGDSRLDEVLTELKDRLEQNKTNPPPKKSFIEFEHSFRPKPNPLDPNPDLNSIHGTEFVAYNDIVFIQTTGDGFVKVRLSTGKTLKKVRLRTDKTQKKPDLTLTYLEKRLKPYGFMRVHTGAIASVRHISGLNRYHNDTHKLTFKHDPEELPVGPVYKKALLEVLRSRQEEPPVI